MRPIVIVLLAVGFAFADERVDLAGDPLPQGALARIGTTRYRLGHYFREVFLTPDGSIIIGNQDQRVIHLVDATTGKPIGTLEDPDLSQFVAALSPDGKKLALFGLDKRGQPAADTTIRVYDLANRKPLWTSVIELPMRLERAIQFTPDGKRIVTASQDLRVWNAETGEELRREELKQAPEKIEISRDGKTVALASHELLLWELDGKTGPRKVTTGPRVENHLCRFAPDGKTVYVGDINLGMRGFDVASGAPAGDLKVGAIRWAMFSPDGKTIATGGINTGGVHPREFGVTLWDAATSKAVQRLEMPQSRANSGAWSADGKRFMAQGDGRLWVWDMPAAKLRGSDAPGHDALINALTFAPDGRLFTSSDDHTIRAWDPTTEMELLKLTMANWARGMDVSPDGSLVAGNALNNDFRVWDAKTGKEVFKLQGHGKMGGLRRVRFSTDEQSLLSLGDDNYLRSWDLLSGKLKAEHRLRLYDRDDPDRDDERFPFALASNRAIDLGRDGTTLAIGIGKDLRIIAADTGKERLRLDMGVRSADNLAIAPDCKRVATLATSPVPAATKGPEVVVWDLPTGMASVRFRTGQNSLRSVLAFSPDGKQLVTDAAPQALQFWDAATGAALGTIELPTRPLRVAFDGGKRVAVGMADATVLVYDMSVAIKK